MKKENLKVKEWFNLLVFMVGFIGYAAVGSWVITKFQDRWYMPLVGGAVAVGSFIYCYTTKSVRACPCCEGKKE